MPGEFIGVWSETWREIWFPLVDREDVPEDVFCELYRELASTLKAKPSVEDLADTIDNPTQSREAFEKTTSDDLSGERALVVFFEAAHPALDDLGGDELSNLYFNLLERFIDKFSLRYDLRRPCALCPTLPGVFASLVRDLRELTTQDPHLDALTKEFEDAMRDLRYGTTDGRIKTCIQKQVNFLEALGAAYPGVTETELGGMCNQIGTWPHAAIKEALKKLYGFASDYPGIRHGKNAKGALRAIEMRDMVAMSILLTGFTPYLELRLNAEQVFGGGEANAQSGARIRPSPNAAVGSYPEQIKTRRTVKDLLNGLLMHLSGGYR